MSPLFFVVVSPLLPRGSTSIPSRYQGIVFDNTLYGIFVHDVLVLFVIPQTGAMFFVHGGYWGYLSSSSASSCPPSFLLVPIMLWWEAAAVDSDGKRGWGASIEFIVLFA